MEEELRKGYGRDKLDNSEEKKKRIGVKEEWGGTREDGLIEQGTLSKDYI